MHKSTFIILLFLITSYLFGQLDPFMPHQAMSSVMDDAFTAGARGVSSFFYNPTGFAEKEGELSFSLSGYALANKETLEKVDVLSFNPLEILIQNVDNVRNTKMDLGVLASIAYSGKGFGIGLFVESELFTEANSSSYTYGSVMSETKTHEVRTFTTITLASGFALPIGPFIVGTQIRPTILSYSNVEPGQSHSTSLFTGLYLGLDAGASVKLGPFELGLIVKDILPIPIKWFYSSGYFGALDFFYDLVLSRTSLNELSPVSQELGATLYHVPPLKVNFGVQFHPDFGTDIVDWKLNVDIRSLLSFLHYLETFEGTPFSADLLGLADKYNFLDYFHLGTEVSFFNDSLSLRLAYGARAFSVAIGAKLWIFETNIGVSAFDLALDNANKIVYEELAVTLETAVRF